MSFRHFFKTKIAFVVIWLATFLIGNLLLRNAVFRDSGYDELLTVIVGVLATIVVTTFSAILVSIQLMSTQFSPRILKEFFSEDGVNQLLLMSYFLCISYCLTIKFLGWVGPQHFFVLFGQKINYAACGIVIGILLILLVFPLFIFRIIKHVNIAYITRKITQKSIKEIHRIYTSNLSIEKSQTIDGHAVYSKQFGYLQNIHYLILKALKPFTGQVQILMVTGAYIGQNFQLAVTEKPLNRWQSYLFRKCFVIGAFRTHVNDINFGIRQLVDVAIKAISPAVNDPTTAVNCTHYIGEILTSIISHWDQRTYEQSLAKNGLYFKKLHFEQILDHAFDQIYFWGKTDYIIVKNLFDVILSLISKNNNLEIHKILCKQLTDFEIMNKSEAELLALWGNAEYLKAMKKGPFERFISLQAKFN